MKAQTLDTCPHACLEGAVGALDMDLHACYALALPPSSNPDVWSDRGALQSPLWGTCSFWPQQNNNLVNVFDLCAKESMSRIDREIEISDGHVCPHRQFLELMRKERGEW